MYVCLYMWRETERERQEILIWKILIFKSYTSLLCVILYKLIFLSEYLFPCYDNDLTDLSEQLSDIRRLCFVNYKVLGKCRLLLLWINSDLNNNCITIGVCAVSVLILSQSYFLPFPALLCSWGGYGPLKLFSLGFFANCTVRGLESNRKWEARDVPTFLPSPVQLSFPHITSPEWLHLPLVVQQAHR